MSNAQPEQTFATLSVVSKNQWRILADQLRQFKGVHLSAVDSETAIALGDRAAHILKEMGIEVADDE